LTESRVLREPTWRKTVANDDLKVSPGLEDRLLEYAEKASETSGDHGAFVADMTEAAALVAAVRNIIERRGA
jgi:hypothetical protein